MSTSAAWSLQTSIFDALNQDTDLQGLIGAPARIYDAIPPEASFPLVQMSTGVMKPFEGVSDGYEHIIRIHAFSNWGGRYECKKIGNAIRAVLHDARLPLDGHVMAQARLVFEDFLRFKDPDVFQAAMRFRFVTVPEVIAA